ncbi:DUF917 domain-containing protein [Thalassotalea litorea]|uniref:DUF917 domain-containing protein n=1 Tax=Thalassotalea litorea TaxID=2020715 RepID=A0A5R9II24_9GAMM|nr:DUF917 domain-containing protein [Thalassotalea litorea]
MTNLSRLDLTDILYGCAILGTGGGGELEEGFDYIDRAFAAGKEFKLVSIDDAPQDAMVCTPYMLGALTPLAAEQELQYNHLPKNTEPAIMTAFKRLQKYTGDEYFGTICCELGGSNTAISFYLAAMFDGYIIDADPAGRAVPEITHSTYYFNDLDAAPIITANEFGECFVLENIIDDQRAEHVVRALSMVSRNDIAAIDHAMSVSKIKDAVIKGTISKALAIGKAFRIAKQESLDIAAQVASHGGGYIAFKGVVKDFKFFTEDGFTLGQVVISGIDQHAGNTYELQVKNENLVGYCNGEVDVTIPDLICCLDLDNKEPVTNPNFHHNMQVAIIILPAPKEFTTPRGLEAFGPSYAGLDIQYAPAIKPLR